MNRYQSASEEFGTVHFKDVEYALTAQADFTNRLLPGGYTNFIDAKEGETYDFELSADAIDSDENKYTVYWIFEAVKGENGAELDSFDYDLVDRVGEA